MVFGLGTTQDVILRLIICAAVFVVVGEIFTPPHAAEVSQWAAIIVAGVAARMCWKFTAASRRKR